jgi:hypothetical protein
VLMVVSGMETGVILSKCLGWIVEEGRMQNRRLILGIGP